MWGGGEYQHPLSERLRLRVGADLAQREYSGSDFDQLFIATHAGPRWLASPITEISLLATAQRQWLGGKPYADETGVRLELDRRLTPRLWARGTAAYRERDHQRATSSTARWWISPPPSRGRRRRCCACTPR